MNSNAGMQSSGSDLCILEDGMGKPLHTQVIESTPEQYHALCRDEAANALLKHSSEVFAYKIHRFNILDGNSAPAKGTVMTKNDLDKLLYRSMSEQGGLKYSYTSPIREYIDKLIRAVPQEHLWSHYAISGKGALNMNYVENFCVGNSQLTWDVLNYNNYKEHNLIVTPHGSWLYDCSSRGLEGMIGFSNFLERNFFDPQFDFDKIIHSSAWIHCSNMPNEINEYTPELFVNKKMYPGGNIDPDKYFVRENSRELDFRPTPENYWQTFIAGWSDVAVPSRSNNIATLLFLEQSGDAPEECLNLFLRSTFAEQYGEFCSEINDFQNVKDIPENMDKLKAMATQIIAENGFIIRGRNQPQQLPEKITQQPFDFFQSEAKTRRHI